MKARWLSLVLLSLAEGCSSADPSTTADASGEDASGGDTSETAAPTDSGAADTDETSAVDTSVVGDAALDTAPPSADASDARILDVSTDASTDANTNTDASTDTAADTAIVCPSSPVGMQPRALWVWQTATYTDPAAKTSFFQFAAAHAVKTIYVQVGNAHMPASGADASQLGTFIAEAAARCIGVELLVGDAHWALTEYHPTAIALAKSATAFTLALTGPKPKAFHVDIEPHGVTGFVSGGVTYDWANDGTGSTTNQRPQILNQWLDGLFRIKAELGTTLPLHADIAFWLDGAELNPLQRVANGVLVGTPRSVHQFVIDMVDRTHIMAYRDKAFGSSCTMASCSANGIYDLSRTEVDYAASVGKTAVVGVETGNYGASISFYEETVAVMDAELAKVTAAYGGNAGMAGVAIHDLVGYRALQAKTP